MSWHEEDNSVSWIFPMRGAVTHPDALMRFLVEQQLTQLATHLKAVIQSDTYLPVRATLSYPAPNHTELYERYLGCPVQFDQPVSKLVYPRSILSARPHLAHGLTSKILQETCDRILGEVKTSTGVVGEVYQIIASTPWRKRRPFRTRMLRCRASLQSRLLCRSQNNQRTNLHPGCLWNPRRAGSGPGKSLHHAIDCGPFIWKRSLPPFRAGRRTPPDGSDNHGSHHGSECASGSGR